MLPTNIPVARIARVRGMAIGFVSAGIGAVPANQTYLDITQGNRVSQSLYDDALPFLQVRPRGVPKSQWARVRSRAAGAPADVVPGLLATTLERAGVRVRTAPNSGDATLVAVNRSGGVPRRAPADCSRACPTLIVRQAVPAQLESLARALGDRDLLIAISQPPPDYRLLTAGIAGRGFTGRLTSSSTRTDGLVTSTDIAPTILERFGLPMPSEMNGEPITGEAPRDLAGLQSFAARLDAIRGRRTPVIRDNLIAWSAIALIACLAFGPRGRRLALALLALSIVYLPAVLLLTAALEPSLLAERLIAAIGAPLLATVTVLVAPGWRGFAMASAVTVAAYAVDVIGGSHLTTTSLPGPSPAAGSRFFGIGNELEAMAGALVPLGAGAALSTRAGTRDGGRSAALAFLLVTALATAVFAIGRFGADVGAAIVLPAGGAVAAAVALGSRRGLALAMAAPVLAIAALVVADVVLGGGAHLTRSVLDAGGLSGLGDVFERRVRLASHSFSVEPARPYLLLSGVAIALGAWRWRDVRGWFTERSALAGFAGAISATVIGTASNDSGALLLVVGALYCAAATAFAWSHRDPGA